MSGTHRVPPLMKNWEWRMKNEKWRMKNEEWRMSVVFSSEETILSTKNQGLRAECFLNSSFGFISSFFILNSSFRIFSFSSLTSCDKRPRVFNWCWRQNPVTKVQNKSRLVFHWGQNVVNWLNHFLAWAKQATGIQISLEGDSTAGSTAGIRQTCSPVNT